MTYTTTTTTTETDAAPADVPPPPTTVAVGPNEVDIPRGTTTLDRLALLTAQGATIAASDIGACTVNDMLAALAERDRAVTACVASVVTEMRAWARTQAHEGRQYAPTYRALIADGELTHHAWRENVETPHEWPILPMDADRPADVDRVRTIVTAPSRPELMHYGACVADIVAAWRTARTEAETDFATLSDSLLAASREHGWCTVYERVVGDLNAITGLAGMGYPFQTRERDYTVSGTMTITVTIPWSTTVTANDEDSAADYATNDLDPADYMYSARLADYDYDVSDVDVDYVEED